MDLFLEPFCFCCWGFGAGSLSDVKEDCETPDLTGGVLAGVGFTHGVPECIGCVTGQFDSAYHCQHLEGRGKRPDPTYGAFVVEGCWGGVCGMQVRRSWKRTVGNSVVSLPTALAGKNEVGER